VTSRYDTRVLLGPRAALKSTVINDGADFRHRDVCQRGAVFERALANTGERVSECNRSQRDALVEHALVKVCEQVGALSAALTSTLWYVFIPGIRPVSCEGGESVGVHWSGETTQKSARCFCSWLLLAG
jgi:hypothetical protein